MAGDVLPFVGVILGVVLLDALFSAYLLHTEHQRGAAELARLEAAHAYERELAAGERTRLAERLAYVEFQLANHMAHVLHLPPPAPPVEDPPLEALPEVMQRFLDAIEDDEARLEFEVDFRHRLKFPGADAAAIVTAALHEAPTNGK